MGSNATASGSDRLGLLDSGGRIHAELLVVKRAGLRGTGSVIRVVNLGMR